MSTQTQTGTATTTLQTFTFSPVQNVFKLENKGSTDIQFNVGKYTNKTLHAYDIFEARVDYESFDVITNDGTSEFEATLTNDTLDLEEVGNDLTIIANVYTPENYGAKGDYLLTDGTINPTPTDDTEAFELMLIDAYANERYPVVSLKAGRMYLTTEALPLNNDVVFTSITTNPSGCGIVNLTTDIFYVPESFTSRIWSYQFNNITLKGVDSTTLITYRSDIQHWRAVWDSVKLTGFGEALNIKMYGTIINDLSISDVKKIGTWIGSDNIISDSIWNGRETEGVDREDDLLTLDGFLLSRFNNLFITGSIEELKGAYNIIQFKDCRDLTFSKCWFDYCDQSAVYNLVANPSKEITFSLCSFRGNQRHPDATKDAYIAMQGCKNISIIGNNYRDVHYGYQNPTAKIYSFKASGGTSENIVIKDNQYEVDYSYVALTGVFVSEPNLKLNSQETFTKSFTATTGVTSYTVVDAGEVDTAKNPIIVAFIRNQPTIQVIKTYLSAGAVLIDIDSMPSDLFCEINTLVAYQGDY